MTKYVCNICSYVYNPEQGDTDAGIKPGTKFEDLPDDWVCCPVLKQVDKTNVNFSIKERNKTMKKQFEQGITKRYSIAFKEKVISEIEEGKYNSLECLFLCISKIG